MWSTSEWQRRVIMVRVAHGRGIMVVRDLCHLWLALTQLRCHCHSCSGVVHHHCTLHDSEKTASTTVPKKAPGIACRLQLLQVWCVGECQCCGDLDFKHLLQQ